jgi:hypothetical protein
MPSFLRNRDAPNAIVGAARRIHLDRRDEVERLRERATAVWQRVAWRHYDTIGAIKYGFGYFAAVSSRIRLYVGYQDEASDAPVPIGNMNDISRSFVTASRYELRKLSRGRGGQPNLIRSLILNILVPGEAFLVGVNDAWEVRSTSELRFEADDRVRLVLSRYERSQVGAYLPKDAFVARIWRTHPEYSDDADSSMKGVQEDCAELLLLSRMMRASARSRLNAGLMYVADELRFQRSSDIARTEPQPNIDPFEEELTLALTEPVGETDSPSEIVPMIVRGPYEFAKDGIQTIDLSRSFDEVVVKRYDQLFNYVLQGLDLPKDIVTGFENVRYSNAREITTDMYRAHVEPAILLVCEALTTVFLRPRLIARGYDPELVDRVNVWYDASGVLVKPDRSDDADEGYKQMLVSGDTWRRAHGFGPADAPTDEEIARRIALSGTVAPSTVSDFVRLIAPELSKKADELAQESLGDSGTGGSSSNTSGQDIVSQDTSGGMPAPASPEQPSTPPIPGNEPPNGTQPPRDGVLSLLDTIRVITGASTQRVSSSSRTRRIDRALEVERRLRESVYVFLNETAQRSLERAGARTISKIRNDPHLKTLVTDSPLVEVFAKLPSERRKTLNLHDKQLVTDTIENAKSRYVDLVTQAQRQGWSVLGGGVVDTLTPNQQENVDRSWKWLAPVLVTLAATRLREPGGDAQYVSIDTVRAAMTRAGGTIPDDNEPTSAISGRAVITESALTATGWEFNGYRWIYGVNDHDVFTPHMSLDGETFGDFTSKILENEHPWPQTRFFYPGDHAGCRCDVVPVPTDDLAKLRDEPILSTASLNGYHRDNT